MSACLLEGSAACKHEEGAAAIACAAEANGCTELLLRFCDTGVVKGELLAKVHISQRVHRNGEATPTRHDYSLAVGRAAVAHAACKGTLQSSAMTCLMILVCQAWKQGVPECQRARR